VVPHPEKKETEKVQQSKRRPTFEKKRSKGSGEGKARKKLTFFAPPRKEIKWVTCMRERDGAIVHLGFGITKTLVKGG